MVFQYISYKKFISDSAKEQKIPSLKLCQSANIQPPFLSRVLRHDAHLNDQQLHSILKQLNITNEEEEDYIQLLLRYEKAYGHHEYKRLLKNRIDVIRNNKLELGERLDKEKVQAISEKDIRSRVYEYYINPKLQLIHMALLIPKYQKNVHQLKDVLSIEGEELGNLINTLVELKFAERKGQQTIAQTPHIHLGKNSILSSANHVMWRVEALKNLSATPSKDGYQFTATISANKEALAELREKIKELIVNYSKYLEDVPSEIVYQLNIDLLPLINK